MVRAQRHSRRTRITLAVSSGAGARILSSLSALVFLPLAVRHLGTERFGIWATVTSTVVFLQVLDLGIAATLTNRVAQAFARSDEKSAAPFISNAIALTTGIAATASLTLLAAWPHINWTALFHVPGSIRQTEVSQTVAAGVALVLLGLPASLTGRIFAGYQEVHRSNLIMAAATAANLLGLVFGIAWAASMPVLLLMATGWTTFLNLAALIVLVVHAKPWLRPRWKYLEWNAARELIGSGVGFFLIQIAGAVVFSSDNLVLSHYLGPVAVTPYNVTWRLVGMAAVVQSLVFPALWPAYAEAYAQGDYQWMRRSFFLTMSVTLAMNMAFALALVTLGPTIIRLWIGSGAVPSLAMLAAMAVWSIIAGCMTVESCLLAAVDRTREQGILSIVAAVINLALSVFLVQRIGATGVILGTILSYLLVLVVPQTLFVRSVLRIRKLEPGECPLNQNAAVQFR